TLVSPVFPRAGRPARATPRGAGGLACGKCRAGHGSGVRRTGRGPDGGGRAARLVRVATATLRRARGSGVLAGQPRLVAGVQSGPGPARARVLAGRGGGGGRGARRGPCAG